MNILELIEDYFVHFRYVKGILAKTKNNNNIYYFRIRKTNYPKVIVIYSIHSREYITSYLALKQIEDFIFNGKSGTVYFIPCVNPDGVDICLKGKPLYKANGNGVDLNVNFDAGFGRGKSNSFYFGESNYVGKHPFSEVESSALKDFTSKIKPNFTISYHSKGEEIYYEFFQDEKEKKSHYQIAKGIARVTGYKIKSTLNSFGGYKDWCISKLNIPAFTIEVGDDNLSHPIEENNLNSIYLKNKDVVMTAIEEYEKEYRQN